jgi:putative PIN family toxin of toxin-antitoxin system
MVAATLDVNVFISAAISPRGTPYQLIEAWHAGRFEVVTSTHIIDQLTLKLRSDRIGRRYGLTTAAIRAFTDPLQHDARLIAIPPADVRPITGDPEDDAVLATARLGQADYLVTGDAGLLARSPYDGIPIITPRAFFELLDG